MIYQLHLQWNLRATVSTNMQKNELNYMKI